MRRKTIVFSAPQGSGKSEKANFLQQYFGCDSTVDNWWPDQPLQMGSLHLTQATPAELAAFEIVPRGLVIAATTLESHTAAPTPIQDPNSFYCIESFLDTHAEDFPPNDGGIHVRVSLRKAYASRRSNVWVPLAAYDLAYGPPASSLDSAALYSSLSALNTSTVSADDAPGSAWSVMALAVNNRSNTRTAADNSIPSARLFRVSSRDVKALEALGFVMEPLSVLGVVEDPHRKAEQGLHPTAEVPA